MGLENGFGWLAKKEREIFENMKREEFSRFEKYLPPNFKLSEYIKHPEIANFLRYIEPHLGKIETKLAKAFIGYFIYYKLDKLPKSQPKKDSHSEKKIIDIGTFFVRTANNNVPWYNYDPSQDEYSYQTHPTNIDQERIKGLASEMFWVILFTEILRSFDPEFEVVMTHYQSSLEPRADLSQNTGSTTPGGVDFYIRNRNNQILPFQVKTNYDSKAERFYQGVYTLFSLVKDTNAVDNLGLTLRDIIKILTKHEIIKQELTTEDINRMITTITSKPHLQKFFQFYEIILYNHNLNPERFAA